MQSSAPSSSSGHINQEPPPPPYNFPAVGAQSAKQASIANTILLSNDGDENLTPRQDPQGEESQLQEKSPAIQSPKFNQQRQEYTQYIRQSNEDKPISTRHKPHSNSVPAPSSQYIQHGVNPAPGRSLDSSTSQIDDKIYAISIPQYRHPPIYGSRGVTGAQINVMQDKQTASSPVSNGLPHHAVPRNGSNMGVPGAYNQGSDQLLPPPPEYPGNRADVRRSYEVLDRAVPSGPQSAGNLSQSSSQPELTNVPTSQYQPPPNSVISSQQPSSSVGSSGYRHPSVDQQQDFAAIAARASQMVDILSEENKSLRNELECYYKKVFKLQKFEFELQEVHEAHNNLVKSSIKKEGLEKAIRMRQDQDIKQLEESNRQNQEKALTLEKTLSDQSVMMSDLSKLVTQHEHTIGHLTKLTNEQKDVINHTQNVVKELTNDLSGERSRSRSFEEELDAYKSNASITMEEESEVKMAALTQSTKDSERIIHEAQAEKLKYMDEAHQACKRVAQLEARLKTLEASCAEKDAIVRVLQRRQRTNLSGRGQASPSLNSVQHTRRISEPLSGAAQRTSQSSLDINAGDESIISDECLQTQTWQV